MSWQAFWLVLLLVGLGAWIWAQPRRPREAILLICSLVALLLFAYTALLGKQPVLHAKGRLDLNRASAEQLAQGLDVSLELATRVVAARKQQPGGRFASLREVPTLAEFYPTLHQKIKSDAKKQGLDLVREPRKRLLAVLGNPGVVDRVIQYRTTTSGTRLSLSDIPAVPLDRLTLRSAEEATALYWWVLLGIIGAGALAHILLCRWRVGGDEFLLPLWLFMAGLSVIVLFGAQDPMRVPSTAILLRSLHAPEFVGQGVFVILGVLVLLIAVRWGRLLEKLQPFHVGLFASCVIGANFAARGGWWMFIGITILGLGGLWFIHQRYHAHFPVAALMIGLTLASVLVRLLTGAAQTLYVELSKLGFLIFLATFARAHPSELYQRAQRLHWRALLTFFGIWAICSLLYVVTGEFGGLLILYVPAVLLVALAARSWRVVVGGMLLMAVMGALMIGSHYALQTPAVQVNPWLVSLLRHPDRFYQRIEVWQHPFINPYSMQMAETLHRVASTPSAWTGVGLGRGYPRMISTTPQDVALPLYFEQLGFPGLTLLLCFYLVVFHRMSRAVLEQREPFRHWLALSLTTALAFQTVIMIASNFNLLPLTGLSLVPLASGGSGMVVSFLMVGLTLWVSSTAQPSLRRNVEPALVKAAVTATAGFAALILLTYLKVSRDGVFASAKVGTQPYALVDYNDPAVQDRTALNENPRLLAVRSQLPRGKIFGRLESNADSLSNRAILAQTTERGRFYPRGALMQPVTGVVSPYGAFGNEERWFTRLTGLKEENPESDDREGDRNLLLQRQAERLLQQWKLTNLPLHTPVHEYFLPVKPQDVQTTVVASLQRLCYDALERYMERKGKTIPRLGRFRKAVLALCDPRTGEYLAYVQYPVTNPNNLSWRQWDALRHDPNDYFHDNISDSRLTPGSVAKINTVLELLMEGKENVRFRCAPDVRVNGRAIDCHGQNHGWVTPELIIKYSCNRGAAQAVEAMGGEGSPGYERLLSLYQQLGYWSEQFGDEKKERLLHDLFARWYDRIAFGQVISASVDDLMRSVCAIANRGVLVRPHLLVDEKPVPISICQPDVAEKMKAYMRAATKPGGTAYRVYDGKYDFPSKTGTATKDERGKLPPDAWFAGFAPYDEPRIAFVLWIEDGGSGARAAEQVGIGNLVAEALKRVK